MKEENDVSKGIIRRGNPNLEVFEYYLRWTEGSNRFEYIKINVSELSDFEIGNIKDTIDDILKSKDCNGILFKGETFLAKIFKREGYEGEITNFYVIEIKDLEKGEITNLYRWFK